MPLLETRGAASARGFGFGAGASGLPAVLDANINIANSTFLGSINLTALGITGPTGLIGSDNNPYVMTVSDNGIYVFLNSYGNENVYRFDMATPYDITTLTATITGQVHLGLSGWMGGSWDIAGTRFSMRSWSGGPMSTYNASNWTPSTFSGGASGGPSSTSYVAAVDNAGNYAYTGNGGNVGTIGQINATTTWSSFATSFNSTYNTTAPGTIYCEFPSGGRTRLFQIVDDYNYIQQVNMPSAGNLASASNGNTFSYASESTAANRRNTMGVMMSNNACWYMLAQRGPTADRFITWWKTGS